ncbi:beta-ACP synthase [Hallella multisaccharivorax DSM 17128]|uniref:Beta-ketoacyl-acyl-carrier-protein synthase II n=1 Tax=Hallella multisaccharivorax DSM 17128 TaxID=688246 RepID=F8N593_9BACT|nr:beta-ketoacyl-[acyl-carrier-protein] synthase family protein [Hallella multisaccharivorax]EGN58258.1 Beta-ketoacyl-acyl-carrier-protein synthase II [Hallella multisaccharivorax DSM 17128]GJG31844.1 beta-ACP synthase [Hallella multisaccharivorax DSM 17128]
MRSVYITGLGVVSAIGNNVQENLQSLREGRSGVAMPVYFKTTDEYPVGEVKMSNEDLSSDLGITGTVYPRNAQLGMKATREAIQSAHLSREKMAFVSGSSVGGRDLLEEYFPDHLTKEMIEKNDNGSITEEIASFFNCFDYISTISTACSSSINSIIAGCELIRNGERDIVLAGGCESLAQSSYKGFGSLRILDTKVCMPFDEQHAGLNLGEGAGYVVLESEESVRRRGVRLLAEVRGYGNACDAFHSTASSPDGRGAYASMSTALDMAHLQADDIQYINAHGTGTVNNDQSESAAITRIFGDQLPAVSSTKSLTGHTTSACGGIETVFCVLALMNQFIPVSRSFQKAADGCVTPEMETEADQGIVNVMNNGFGFGGNDSTIVISKIHEESIC